MFARSLLAPFAAMHRLHRAGALQAMRIATHFGIPHSAAKTRLPEYEYWRLFGSPHAGKLIT